jgi:hypothetical protein
MLLKLVPKNEEISDAADKRHNMVIQCRPLLEKFADELTETQVKNTEVVLVCIEVDCEWRNLAMQLNPDAVWETIHNHGLEPVAVGKIGAAVSEQIAEKFPEIQDAILAVALSGHYKCLAIDEHGCSAYFVPIK